MKIDLIALGKELIDRMPGRAFDKLTINSGVLSLQARTCWADQEDGAREYFNVVMEVYNRGLVAHWHDYGAILKRDRQQNESYTDETDLRAQIEQWINTYWGEDEQD